MSRKINWFDRGRVALTEGNPCEITDARINGVDRQAWHDGWQHQQHLNAPQMSDADRKHLIDFFQSLRTPVKQAASPLQPSCKGP